MPEGDSLHNLASRLSPVLLDREVTSFTARRIADDAARSLVGKRVVEVRAKGKNLLVRFDDQRVLHIHLKMEGRVYVERPRSAFWAPRPVSRHPELRMTMSGGATVVGHRLPVCRLLTAAAEKRAPDLQRLGPDLCDAQFVESEALQAEAVRRLVELGPRSDGGFTSKPRSNITIAEALLVQRAAAGIGNVYKSEVLFLERVDPRALVASLPDETLRRLLLRASVLLRRNLKRGPRTTRPTLTSTRLWVYGRAGRPCLRCESGTIEMFKEGSAGTASGPRSTYFCPTCQEER